jgi:hypothetical protein
MKRHIDKIFAVREWRKIIYRYNHREQHREFCRKWYLSIRGKKKRKEWNKTHPDFNRSHCAKRRKLGFIPLNKSFAGSEAHHIDKIYVVYIPRELHISVPHNIRTGCNMGEINGKTFEWLKYHNV